MQSALSNLEDWILRYIRIYLYFLFISRRERVYEQKGERQETQYGKENTRKKLHNKVTWEMYSSITEHYARSSKT